MRSLIAQHVATACCRKKNERTKERKNARTQQLTPAQRRGRGLAVRAKAREERHALEIANEDAAAAASKGKAAGVVWTKAHGGGALSSGSPRSERDPAGLGLGLGYFIWGMKVWKDTSVMYVPTGNCGFAVG